MDNEQELIDLLQSIKNKTEIAALLINMGKPELLPTVLEDMFINVHEILDRWCIKER